MSITKEKLEIWAHIAEIVAAIGVIVSVLYLAAEISEGTATLKAQTHFNVLTASNEPLSQILSDESLAKIVVAGQRDPDALSDTDWYRFSIYNFLAFNVWEYTYYLDQSGSTPHELWIGLDAYMRDNLLSWPGIRRFWEESESAYAEPFHGYVEAVLEGA
jgi:hypothetical protein